MARRKKSQFLALKWGRKTPFRRTIQSGTADAPASVTMVFEPGLKYEVTADEAAQLQREVDCGMLVDPCSDVKGRFKDCREVTKAEPEQAAEEEAATDTAEA